MVFTVLYMETVKKDTSGLNQSRQQALYWHDGTTIILLLNKED